MAAKSSLNLLRRFSRPYASIQKAPVLVSSESRLFNASKSPMQSIPKPEWVPLGGLQRIYALGLFKSGSPASNCRNYARGRNPASEEDEDDDADDDDEGSDAFEDDIDEDDEDNDLDDVSEEE